MLTYMYLEYTIRAVSRAPHAVPNSEALAMARKQRPAATENGWPEPVSGQNVELLGSLESPEDVDADRGQQR